MTSEPIPDGLWRTGRSWGRTIVIQTGPEPGSHGTDHLVGFARDDTEGRRHARIACDAVNGEPVPPGLRWWSSGSLIYDGPGASLTRDWVIAVDTPEQAQRIVTAVRGEP